MFILIVEGAKSFVKFFTQTLGDIKPNYHFFNMHFKLIIYDDNPLDS